MTRACLLILAIALGACSSAGDGWVKPGADRQAADAAYRECRALADHAVGTDLAIDKDIMATRGNDWQRADVTHIELGAMRENARVHGDRVIASCMQSKGFSRPAVPSRPLALPLP